MLAIFPLIFVWGSNIQPRITLHLQSTWKFAYVYQPYTLLCRSSPVVHYESQRHKFWSSPLGNLGQRPFALTPGSCSICKQAPSSKHCPFQETKHVETVDFPQFTKKTCNIVGCAIEVYACTVITPTWLWCFTLAHFPILLSSWVHFYEDLWASSLKLATSWPKVSSPAFLHHHLSDLGIRDMLPGKKGVKRPRKRTSLAVLLEHDPLDH